MSTSEELNQQEVAVALVTRIRAGDAQAETDLVNTYGRGLRYQLRRMTTDHALCDDLFQDTFQMVLTKVRAGDLREPEKLPGFIRKSAQNIYIADYRKKARRNTHTGHEETYATADGSMGQDEAMERKQEAQLVRRIIGELGTERDRRLLYRFYVAQEDKGEICRDLDIDPGIFNRILYRARQRFKELWLEQSRKAGNLIQGLLVLLRWW